MPRPGPTPAVSPFMIDISEQLSSLPRPMPIDPTRFQSVQRAKRVFCAQQQSRGSIDSGGRHHGTRIPVYSLFTLGSNASLGTSEGVSRFRGADAPTGRGPFAAWQVFEFHEHLYRTTTCPVPVPAALRQGTSWRPAKAWDKVPLSTYSSSPPRGTPWAIRVARTPLARAISLM